jgi:homocysteine S-methyltransferase
MPARNETRHSILAGVRVLDGGLASECEFLGANIDGPLWSAHVLEDLPELVVAVHRAYIEAGADCISTASYQVSRMGYAEFGFAPERADEALVKSVELARIAAREFADRRICIAASLGPYGAALHNGAEYHGNYDCSFAELVEFHRQRILVLANSKPKADLLAFETLPSLDEARAIGLALADFPALQAWFSFTCRFIGHDGAHVAHGEPLHECAALVAEFPQTVAIGVNCVAPSLIPGLIAELRGASNKPVIVYPNSGEGWDAAHRSWSANKSGTSDPEEYGALAAQWFAAGAQIVGGCCRTRPAHIREIREAARAVGS